MAKKVTQAFIPKTTTYEVIDEEKDDDERE